MELLPSQVLDVVGVLWVLQPVGGSFQ